MRHWFLTESQQIIDLNRMTEFWTEDCTQCGCGHKVFCRDIEPIDWMIAEFPTEKQADQYIKNIYQKLLYAKEADEN